MIFAIRSIRVRVLTKLIIVTWTLTLPGCGIFESKEPDAEIQNVTIEQGGHPSIRKAIVTLDIESRIMIDYWATEGEPLSVVSDPSIQHEVALGRLVQGEMYNYQVTVVTNDTRAEESHEGSFETDSLPSKLNAVNVDFDGQPSFELFASTYNTLNDSGFTGLIVWNSDGDIVWWWEELAGISAFDRLPNGDFTFLIRGEGVSIVSPLEGVIATQASPTSDFNFHHDLEVTESGNILILCKKLAQTSEGEIMSASIWEWDLEAQTILEKWVAADWLDPAVDRGVKSNPGDWWHSNSINIGPRGNVLVSLRSTDEVVSIKSDFSGIEWSLGGPISSFVVDDPFFAQHEASEYANNRVLVFDNHLVYVDGAYVFPEGKSTSRLIEFELDENNGTAQKVWSFEPPQAIKSRTKNSTFKMPNGHSVATFTQGRNNPSTAYEIDSQGGLVWSLEYPEAWVVYGNAIESLVGEVQK